MSKASFGLRRRTWCSLGGELSHNPDLARLGSRDLKARSLPGLPRRPSQVHHARGTILEQNIPTAPLRAILAAAGNTDPDSETISLIALRLRTIAHQYHYEKAVRPAEAAAAAKEAIHFSKVYKRTSELIKTLEDVDGARIPEIVVELNWLSNAAEHSRDVCMHTAGKAAPVPQQVAWPGARNSAKAGDLVKHKQHPETSLYLALLELYGEFTKQRTRSVAEPFYQFAKICGGYLHLNIIIPSSCDSFRKTVTEARRRRMKNEADKAKDRAKRKNQGLAKN
jgi:hypothetical protein